MGTFREVKDWVGRPSITVPIWLMLGAILMGIADDNN